MLLSWRKEARVLRYSGRHSAIDTKNWKAGVLFLWSECYCVEFRPSDTFLGVIFT